VGRLVTVRVRKQTRLTLARVRRQSCLRFAGACLLGRTTSYDCVPACACDRDRAPEVISVCLINAVHLHTEPVFVRVRFFSTCSLCQWPVTRASHTALARRFMLGRVHTTTRFLKKRLNTIAGSTPLHRVAMPRSARRRLAPSPTRCFPP
jgi:hypothetical protein